MTRDQLEHAIRAACDVSKDTELWIFGSQAILGEFPNAPESLRASIEVDVQPKNRPETVDDIDGTLGGLSLFHKTHGFYVHGISIESAKLPDGWDQRTVPVNDPISTHGKTGLEPSRCVVWPRPKCATFDDLFSLDAFHAHLSTCDIPLPKTACRLENHPYHRHSPVHPTISAKDGDPDAEKPDPWGRSPFADYWKKEIRVGRARTVETMGPPVCSFCPLTTDP